MQYLFYIISVINQVLIFMIRKSTFFKYGKHQSPDELIKHLNQCSLCPKFIENKSQANVTNQNTVVLNKVELRKSKSKDCERSATMNRSRLQREYLRFLLTTDGPTSEFYQLEKKKLQIKLQDIYETAQPNVCLSKLLVQYQQLVNPF
ncbi:unnamed protein product [Paramecium octaurelia]|uniref:Uncharacterized protein n=1 Tax=Paramecium octaurelia TaxID=43137 RepID=A0A8S1U3N8_PAROT|nr:unnamed protein product [Paramecium octaurelia]